MTNNPVPAQVEDEQLQHLPQHYQPEVLGPAVAPYPPPAPYQDQKQRKYFSSHLRLIFYVFRRGVCGERGSYHEAGRETEQVEGGSQHEVH